MPRCIVIKYFSCNGTELALSHQSLLLYFALLRPSTAKAPYDSKCAEIGLVGPLPTIHGVASRKL